MAYITRADMVALFESFGAGAAEYEEFSRMMNRAMSQAPTPLRAESDVIMSLLNDPSQRATLAAAPEVPTR
jgi:hypothetical protein